jgi:putative phosphoesterase
LHIFWAYFGPQDGARLTRIGVISDTHGRVHPRVFELFAGVDHILHAGDIGAEEVLIDLRAIAPVTAVRGNVDELRDCARYPAEAALTVGSVRIHMVHRIDPVLERLRGGAWAAPRPDVVVFGHSHKGAVERVDGILLFNPGSAGPRRFKLVPSVGRLTVDRGTVFPEVIALEPGEDPGQDPGKREAVATV